MLENNKIWFASDENGPLYLNLNMANRHGLIAGATGTGKTTSLRVLAEGFSNAGVPVFMADVKGDLSGLVEEGGAKSWIENRVEELNISSFSYDKFPVHFWDVFGEKGHPVRVTISQMGPTLLSRLLNLTEVQEGVLTIVFKIADDNNLLLIDLKDLRSMVQYVGDHKEEYTLKYGNIATQSLGAIQRSLLTLEDQGGNIFFGEPELDIADWLRTDRNGKGYINILSASSIINSPKIYSTFLLWMLSELYERLPEVGDLDAPRIVFFFDEAHLLFSDAPKALLQKVTQVVKLIRSKGVGIYFISQSPSDIPDEVLSQLQNRVQHALRAYTPSEQKAVKTAASTFRQNPSFKVEDAISQMGVGEALVSFLDEKGVPEVVRRTKVLPPQSKDGECDESLMNKMIAISEFDLKYRVAVDSYSAYEAIEEASIEEEKEKIRLQEEKIAAKEEAKKQAAYEKQKQKIASQRSKTIERAINSATSTVTRSVSRNVVNSLTGGKKTSASTIASRAATNAVNSLLSSAGKSIVRGIFGNIK